MNSKAKGRRGELELAKALTDLGYRCRRGQQYSGSPDSPDVVGLPGIHIECKRVEHLELYKAMSQAVRDAGHNIPGVFHRKNNCEWLVTMRLDDWMTIYREWEASNDIKRSGANTQEGALAGEGDKG